MKIWGEEEEGGGGVIGNSTFGLTQNKFWVHEFYDTKKLKGVEQKILFQGLDGCQNLKKEFKILKKKS